MEALRLVDPPLLTPFRFQCGHLVLEHHLVLGPPPETFPELKLLPVFCRCDTGTWETGHGAPRSRWDALVVSHRQSHAQR